MEKLKSGISRHAYYQQWAERRADKLDRKNFILRWEIGALKADHKDEVEQLQQENQQLRDQVDDLREHIDQLAEMIPDEPKENPEEDLMEYQDDEGELTEGSIIDGEYFLGLQIARFPEEISLSQTKYIYDILADTGLQTAKSATSHLPQGVKFSRDAGSPLSDPEPYRHLVGGLLYIGFTRPDIAHGVQQLTQFLQHPCDTH
ncbi:UNVERIFIED_CONTAM: hypothetical protein Sradi_4526900 [Sesamum radiatum]|uniref:Uncharacterized protein n=1 Tax=Sesamum radiatum TaxID=300843 RepID=A0AAW2NCH5_SESRA